ncbi:hypothetical protein [Streptomyces sp. st170]|uniref:hypothetical protein n=1 Tax=Streptomyces sp. st170 TaxID=1828058 RepID=UPI000BF21E76|nr:hypothetical protein [Streptomyces sp. st170]
MAGNFEAFDRRLRRLTEMQRIKAVHQASAALREVWNTGRQPAFVKLRSHLLYQGNGDQQPLTCLVNSRGIALRFYLLAIFEAQCRLNVGDQWNNVRGLARERLSWSDFVAIDGAYDTKTRTYMPDTKQGRDRQALRLRQVQGALRTLEEFDARRSLVTIPRAKSGGRLYGAFSLMTEVGRGELQTPNAYTVPSRGWNGNRTLTISIPSDFFLNGWVQVLTPSEAATWLILRELSQYAPTKHVEEGVYLYGKMRTEMFGLKRDAWEDSCHMLRNLGLIRYFKPGDPQADNANGGFSLGIYLTQLTRDRYEPYRYQITDHGLAQDALERVVKEVTLLRASARPKNVSPDVNPDQPSTSS